jgi:PAS domain S-box-containing protein
MLNRRRVFSAFIVLSCVILVSGLWHHYKQDQEALNSAFDELEIIADLKLSQVSQWRQQLRSDAGYLREGLAARRIAIPLLVSGSESLRKEMVLWSREFLDHHVRTGYKRFTLLDTRGKVRFSFGLGPQMVKQQEEVFAQGMRSGSIRLYELRKESESSICLEVLAPLLDGQGRVVGSFLLHVDPSAQLYDDLQKWPTNSPSGEVLLVRSDGDDVFYLNELRHQQGTALTLRLPKGDPHLPAAAAVQRRNMRIGGRDYRGVQVLAVTRAVPDSDWGLVAKFDRKEAKGHLAVSMINDLVVTSLLLSLIALLGLYLRQRMRKQESAGKMEAFSRYEQLLRHANDIILLLGADGKILDANDKALAVYGYSRDEMARLNVLDLRAPETLKNFDKQLSEAITPEGVRLETVHLSKDGRRIPMEVSARCVTIGKDRFIQSIIRDISERVQREQRLVEINDCFVRFGPDPLKNIDALVSLCGRLLCADAALYNKLEDGELCVVGAWNAPGDIKRNDKIEGHICMDIIRSIEKKPIVIQNLQESRYAVTDPAVKKYGLKTYAGCGVRCDAKTVGSLCVVYTRDFTPSSEDLRILSILAAAVSVEEGRRKLQQELVNVQKMESLGALAGGIAHDFNNHLTAIQGNLSLAKEEAPAGELAELIEEALKASRDAKRLAQRLLTFSKGGKPIKKVLAPEPLLRDCAEFVLHGSKSQCDFEVQEGLWNFEVDEGQLEQVFQNILINAVEAMPEGGRILVRAENVELSAADAVPLPPGRYVRTTIVDHGPGISPEHMPKIFEPYFTTRQRGRGLGLTTSFSIVKGHGGHLSADCIPKMGTSLMVYLPWTDKPLPVQGPKTAVEKGSGRILVLDDDSGVARALTRMLSKLGYESEIVTDGARVLGAYEAAQAESRPFKALIMDLTIAGGMGGQEAIRLLRKKHPKVTAIVSSGYSSDPIMAEYAQHGFDAVLAKPYRLEELSEVLGRVLIPA